MTYLQNSFKNFRLDLSNVSISYITAKGIGRQLIIEASDIKRDLPLASGTAKNFRKAFHEPTVFENKVLSFSELFQKSIDKLIVRTFENERRLQSFDSNIFFRIGIMQIYQTQPEVTLQTLQSLLESSQAYSHIIEEIIFQSDSINRIASSSYNAHNNSQIANMQTAYLLLKEQALHAYVANDQYRTSYLTFYNKVFNAIKKLS